MNQKHESDKAMVEQLKTNWTAFGGLSKEQQEFLKANRKSVGILSNNGEVGCVGYCDVSDEVIVYRLSPSFVLPEPVKEWFWFATISTSLITQPEKPCGNRIEITSDQKAYLETKPEAVAGFEWILKVPFKGEKYLTVKELAMFTANSNEEVNTERINGIRWVRVPIKVEPKFVEVTLPIIKDSKGRLSVALDGMKPLSEAWLYSINRGLCAWFSYPDEKKQVIWVTNPCGMNGKAPTQMRVTMIGGEK